MQPEDDLPVKNPVSGEDGPDEDEDFFYHGPPTPPFPPYFDERELQINEDYEWCLHDPVVQQQYAKQVVVAHRGRIWGSGKNHSEAIRAALRAPGCPPKENVAMVYIEGWPLQGPI